MSSIAITFKSPGKATIQWMPREAAEAHLLLHGWRAVFWGLGGAAKFDGREWTVIYLRNAARGRVEVHHQNITALKPDRFCDGPYPWGHIGSDGNFCLLANQCIAEDADPFPF